MRSQRGWRRSVVARLTALAALGLLLPALILFVLQYRSLLELQAKTRSATRETLAQSLYLVSARMEHAVLAIATTALRDFAVGEPDDLYLARARLVVARECEPHMVRGFFVTDRPMTKTAWALLDWSAGPAPATEIGSDLPNSPKTKEAFLAWYKARPLTGSAPEPGSLSFYQASPRSDLYVFKNLTPAGTESNTLVFAGVTLQGAFLVAKLRDVVSQAQGEMKVDGQTAVAFGLLDARKREVVRFSGGPVQWEQGRSLSPMFAFWTLAAGYAGTTLDDLARAQFRANLGLTILVLLFLVVGSALIVRAAAREAKLAQLKASFVSNVSHEMKTPLALIRLFAETLESGRVAGAEKIQEYYRVIHRESRRLTQLVDNVLDFSRMEAGRKEYRFETGNVADLVEEVVCGYDDHLRGAGFEMQLEVEPDLPPVTFDAAALSQALANLLDNSMKYSPDRKAIAVVVRRDESGVAIEVADRGIGIPRAEQQKIFEKFYRVDTEVVRTTRGSGLGLALTRHIVEAHGGRIVVDSTPGEGSRFRIVLPAVANVQQT